MTDYSEWTETEVPAEEFATLPNERRGFDNHVRGNNVTTTYFRLDPPAPKHREGEMRWITFHATGNRYVATRRGGAWVSGADFPLALDEHAEMFTLSDPVVVVPAPTDEERADFLGEFDRGAGYWQTPRFKWMQRVADVLRKEARDV